MMETETERAVRIAEEFAAALGAEQEAADANDKGLLAQARSMQRRTALQIARAIAAPDASVPTLSHA